MLLKLPLLRLLAINLAAGFAVAALAVFGLLLLDPFGLRALMLRDSAGIVAFFLLAFGFVVTFASCTMGTAIMTLSSKR